MTHSESDTDIDDTQINVFVCLCVFHKSPDFSFNPIAAMKADPWDAPTRTAEERARFYAQAAEKVVIAEVREGKRKRREEEKKWEEEKKKKKEHEAQDKKKEQEAQDKKKQKK